jgi:hypothetical protein
MDPDDREAVLLVRFALESFWPGLFNASSSQQNVALAFSNRFASWSKRTNPRPIMVVVRRSQSSCVNWS